MSIVQEFKVIALREMPYPEEMILCDTPDQVVTYWERAIRGSPQFNPECECFAALFLTSRRRVRGHILVSHGTMDTLLVHPREVFRAAIIASTSAIILAHNHPSGVIPHPVLCRMACDFSRFCRVNHSLNAA